MQSTLNSGIRIDAESIQAELESLTHKLYEGDATYLIYSLFKNTHDKKGLLEFLSQEEVEDVCVSNTAGAVSTDCNSRPCFKEWIANCEQL